MSKSINFAFVKSNDFSSRQIGQIINVNSINNTSNNNNTCESYLADQYNTTCFTGYYSESFIDANPYDAYDPIHTGLRNDLDVLINAGFSNFGITADPNFFLAQTNMTNNSAPILEILGNEQLSLADSLQNISTLSDEIADQIMAEKVREQEIRVMNDPFISYDDKEFILTTLEIELQNKQNYINQFGYEDSYGNVVVNSQNKKRSFLGKIWRGLAFVAITVATAGKVAAVIAAKAYTIAGKAALFTSSLKKAYFALGVAAAWVPTGVTLIEKEKWNENPWGSGNFTDILKFGSGILGVIDAPYFNWTI